MIYFMIAAYLYVGLCMWAAMPPTVAWYGRLIAFLHWPGVLLTAIFSRLINIEVWENDSDPWDPDAPLTHLPSESVTSELPGSAALIATLGDWWA